MQIEKFNKLLTRYSSGKANETEKALVEAWYKSYDAGEQSVSTDAERQERARLFLHTRMHVTSARKVRSANMIFLRIAASLLSLIVAGIAYYSMRPEVLSYTAIRAAAGKVKKIELPDGSVAWINSLSTLRVPEKFESSKREVFIDEGEVFFEVRRNPDQPFIVHAPELDVQVLGTSFDVQAYKDAAEISVAVSTGKVAVSKGDQQLANITPGLRLLYNKNRKSHRKDSINTAEANAWRQGDIYLRQASFADLALAMKNTYGIVLTAGHASVQNYHFTLRMRADVSVDETLKLIQSIHNTQIRKEGGKVVLY